MNEAEKMPKWVPNFTVKADHMSRPIIEAGHTLIHSPTNRIWVAMRVHTELTPTIPHAPAPMTREIVHCWIVNGGYRIGCIDRSNPGQMNDFWPLAIGGSFDTGETIATRKEIVAERSKNPKMFGNQWEEMFGNQWEANTELLAELEKVMDCYTQAGVAEGGAAYGSDFTLWLAACYMADTVQKHGLYLAGQGLL